MRWPSGWYSAAAFLRSPKCSFTNSTGNRRRNVDGNPIRTSPVTSRRHSSWESGTGADQAKTGTSRKIRTTALIAKAILLGQGPCIQAVVAHLIQKSRGLGENHAGRAIIHIHGVGQIEILFGPGDRDVEQAALLFQILFCGEGIEGGEFTVERPDDEHAMPFQAFRRMDRGQDQALLITVWSFQIHDAFVRS